jgi:NADH:ubiquinone oxidoreductase subunit 3 (subunit A)
VKVSGWRRIWTLVESVIAFAAVLAASTIIYLLGRLKAPKTPRNREKSSMYACGETVHSRRLAINITLYKYLVYFIILDSSVLIMAFASLATNPTSLAPLMIYLFTVFAAVLLLAVDGD